MTPVRLARIDAVLEAHAAALGADRVPYGDHAHRVANLCLAAAHLAGAGRGDWGPEIGEMILQHQKATRCGPNPAGWSSRCGARTGSTSAAASRGSSRRGRWLPALHEAWPGAGFHKRPVQLELGHPHRHPLKPLPVLGL